jgi:lysophospholipase L1-like esterase
MITLFRTHTALMTVVVWMVVGAPCVVRADLRVMPLGDSNTVGFHELPNGSYRYFLEQHFTGNSIPYNFVGSKFSGGPSLYDRNHEGWDGFTVQDLTAEIIASDTINMFQPDVVLLLIGTNNRGEPRDYNVYKGWYDSLFDAIGNVPVVAATVPRVGPWIYLNPFAVDEANNKRIPLMNQVMYDIAAEPGRENITIVDYYSVLDPNTHLLSDGIHFNTAGHQLLANLFIQGMSVAVPEPSQVLMMLIPVVGMAIVGGKRWWARRRAG